MSREVMQQALDALTDGWTEYYRHTSPRTGQWALDAIESLRAELAKPAPVAVPEGMEHKSGFLRSAGWAVAVHNDYRLTGEAHTFWLFTKGDRAIKGEGRTDEEALDAVILAAASQPPAPAVDVEAVRAICQRMREHGGVGRSWADQLERAIGDET